MSTSDAGTAERTQDNMEGLDAKVTNEKETRAMGIEIGDFISFWTRELLWQKLGFIKSRHLDDSVSAGNSAQSSSCL